MSQIKQVTGELCCSLLGNINKNIDSVSFEFAGQNELKIRFILLEHTKTEKGLLKNIMTEFASLNSLSKEFSSEAFLKENNDIPNYNVLYKKFSPPSYKLSKKVRIKSIELDDDILSDGFDDKTKIVTVTLSKEKEEFKFKVGDFISNTARFLEYKLSDTDYAKFIKASKLKASKMRNVIYYKTKDRLKPYYHIVKAESGQQYLLCIGYGEYQPMRYLATLESIHEIVD